MEEIRCLRCNKKIDSNTSEKNTKKRSYCDDCITHIFKLGKIEE